ncbi:zinc ABC transporter solute-binding protein [Sulfurovum sp. bin170]|uniref:metal ABC transporter solute-binding protein, Zn/Mn family n=1 Tax=Sulfurovum sp. bin170 TaxID=2695268 RepID=UPI0013DE933B|nr:zinc ABC transporter substrate-binding protein [Sulfurovum sp. bin170]NEW61222.1 zinc ABC transporter solute-binding protein [Sulfurovum sp. bin170]
MKKSLFIILSLFVTLPAFAKLRVVVSIQPQLEFVSKIGGEKIETSLMVLPGNSPHTYEPKPSQMRDIAKADLYLAIDVEFEKVWLSKFKNQNRELIVKNIAKDINRTAMQSHHHHEHKEEIALDPHIWVDPINVKQIARNIFEALSTIDADNSKYYKNNLDSYLKELDLLDREIRTILEKSPKETTFMVFHPAWGYFASRYNLKQLAIEVEGKTPKPKQLISIIKEAKKENIKAIFTQPEFSDQVARTIANSLDIEVIKTSPLAKNWGENLKNLAVAIAKGNR